MAKYIVTWSDQEGIQQEMSFDRLKDAQLEAAWLEDRYDSVEIKTAP